MCPHTPRPADQGVKPASPVGRVYSRATPAFRPVRPAIRSCRGPAIRAVALHASSRCHVASRVASVLARFGWRRSYLPFTMLGEARPCPRRGIKTPGPNPLYAKMLQQALGIVSRLADSVRHVVEDLTGSGREHGAKQAMLGPSSSMPRAPPQHPAAPRGAVAPMLTAASIPSTAQSGTASSPAGASVVRKVATRRPSTARPSGGRSCTGTCGGASTAMASIGTLNRARCCRQDWMTSASETVMAPLEVEKLGHDALLMVRPASDQQQQRQRVDDAGDHERHHGVAHHALDADADADAGHGGAVAVGRCCSSLKSFFLTCASRNGRRGHAICARKASPHRGPVHNRLRIARCGRGPGKRVPRPGPPVARHGGDARAFERKRRLHPGVAQGQATCGRLGCLFVAWLHRQIRRLPNRE